MSARTRFNAATANGRLLSGPGSGVVDRRECEVTIPGLASFEARWRRYGLGLAHLDNDSWLSRYVRIPLKVIELEIVKGVERGLEPITGFVRDESFFAETLKRILAAHDISQTVSFGCHSVSEIGTCIRAQ
jgi:hypothetical protein